ncbi:MAG: FHA domain-containing protein [Candidatus Eremiobacterota bacterium]
MTILRRWVLNLAGLLMGAACGLWGYDYLRLRVEMPGAAGVFLVVLSMTVFGLITYAVGMWLFPSSVEEQIIIRPEVPRQPWAWLRPRGEGLKPGFGLHKDQVIIGRDVRCDLMINNESVSRKHSEVVRLAEGYLLRDLGSRNGTFVNGQRVQEYILNDGDTVAIGDVQFTFEAPRRPVPLNEPDPVSHLLASDLGAQVAGVTQDEDDTEVWNTRPPGV